MSQNETPSLTHLWSKYMRLRNIPGSREEIAASRFAVNEPEVNKGRWAEIFGNDNPVRIEVGMGRGRFLMNLACAYSQFNYIGIEMYSSVLIRAIQKAQVIDPCPQNFRFIRMDAQDLESVFAPGEVDRIYLNFSDPWPKARHAHRRLTSQTFLRRYEKILRSGGRIEFKTDNTELFEYSLEEIAVAGWNLIAETRDLHHDPLLNEGNIMTEYEERFSLKGNPICKLIAAPVRTY